MSQIDTGNVSSIFIAIENKKHFASTGWRFLLEGASEVMLRLNVTHYTLYVLTLSLSLRDTFTATLEAEADCILKQAHFHTSNGFHEAE